MVIKLQIGKNGLTKEFMEELKKRFEDSGNARINILSHATRDKAKAKEWAEEIITFLGKNFTYKLIGYTLVVTKWRKARVKA